MNIVLYNINSFGGNHEYVLQLFQAYRHEPEVKSVELIMPSNSPVAEGQGISKVLLPDKLKKGGALARKGYFLYRSLINPLRLYRLLKKKPSSVVVFNDYDQLTAFLWVPLFRRLKQQHHFAVILHDPDRDKYLPVKSLAVASMNKVMSLVNIAFYHGYLPDKPYYKKNLLKIEVPHGVFPPAEGSAAFGKMIKEKKSKPYLLGILGNIRDEKNYELVIEGLPSLPDCQLLVAGAKASSDVPVARYQEKIRNLHLEDRVIWIERYLDEQELSTAIRSCDIILLYYKTSFTSQSGMLNMIAPYRKKLVVTDTPSALQKVTRQYQLGVLVPADDKEALVSAVHSLLAQSQEVFTAGWEQYKSEASWAKHARLAVNAFNMLPAI
jgi:glycosyltransferase involved in cell wall biosynthesis